MEWVLLLTTTNSHKYVYIGKMIKNKPFLQAGSSLDEHTQQPIFNDKKLPYIQHNDEDDILFHQIMMKGWYRGGLRGVGVRNYKDYVQKYDKLWSTFFRFY